MDQDCVFLKLGGSLLTDKTRPQTLRPDVLRRLAGEIARALAERPGLRLLVGHGSGSFGHMAASKYGTRRGVQTSTEWRGYAETALAAAHLHRLVADALWDAGVAVLSAPPSASARCRAGELIDLDDRPVRAALAHGLVPLVHGDVALDDTQGGTIVSTEQVFRWLAPRLQPAQVLLVGEVRGVLTADPALDAGGDLIPEINRANLATWAPVLGGSRGVDVTGGMLAKVEEMMGLLRQVPGQAEVRIISGLEAGLLYRVLVDSAYDAGTRIRLGS